MPKLAIPRLRVGGHETAVTGNAWLGESGVQIEVYSLGSLGARRASNFKLPDGPPWGEMP